MLRLLVIAWLVTLALPARADSVALLPLDGEKRLEIYGQPVANELARAMKAAGVDVVVVGAKMAVPENVQLIVDGTIKSKGSTITLELRIRDPRDGTTLEKLPPATEALTDIDKAAAEVSAKVVPSVKAQLEAIAKRATPPVPVTDKPVEHPPVTAPAPDAELPPIVVAVASPGATDIANTALRAAITAELDGWSRRHGHAVKTIEAAKLERRNAAPGNVAASGAQVGMALEVLGFQVTPGKVPLAVARVRLTIITPERVAFDRVIATDTIVGDKNITEQAFAARAAREVLSIAQPNLRRSVSGWR